MVVVFPAPFGPQESTDLPFSTVKDMLSTAVVRPYRLVRTFNFDHRSGQEYKSPESCCSLA